MPLYFVTGNKNKFSEVAAIIPSLEHIDIDLPEIQEIDAKVIVEMKLQEALQHTQGACIIEDTSLYMDCLKGLPGPLIKWFLQTTGTEGLATIAEKLENNSAEVRTLVGYAKNHTEIYFFEGGVHGHIVSPRGTGGFGWDTIFQPEGNTKTFAEIKESYPGVNEMRLKAYTQLKQFLEKHGST